MIRSVLFAAAMSSTVVAQVDPLSGGVFDLGGGLSGVDGIPQCDLSGTFDDGGLVDFTLESAEINANAVLIIGASVINFPFLGGILVPSPDIVVEVQTSSSGTATVTVPWSSSLPDTLYCQWLVPDATAAQGVALSNTVQLRTGSFDLKIGALKIYKCTWASTGVTGTTILTITHCQFPFITEDWASIPGTGGVLGQQIPGGGGDPMVTLSSAAGPPATVTIPPGNPGGIGSGRYVAC